MIKIEKNIPIPKKGSGRDAPHEILVLIRKMKKGDSFKIPLSDIGKAYVKLNNYSKKNKDFAYTTRRSKTIMRIWRTK